MNSWPTASSIVPQPLQSRQASIHFSFFCTYFCIRQWCVHEARSLFRPKLRRVNSRHGLNLPPRMKLPIGGRPCPWGDGFSNQRSRPAEGACQHCYGFLATNAGSGQKTNWRGDTTEQLVPIWSQREIRRFAAGLRKWSRGGRLEVFRGGSSKPVVARKSLNWRAWQDSNLRPLPSEGSTLSS